MYKEKTNKQWVSKNCTGEEPYCLSLIIHAEFVKCKEVDGNSIMLFYSKNITVAQSLFPKYVFNVLISSSIWAVTEQL